MPPALHSGGPVLVLPLRRAFPARPSSTSIQQELSKRTAASTTTSRKRPLLAQYSRNTVSADTADRAKYQQRFQHDSHGPHKEYFQNPGQAPKPDLSPYRRPDPSTITPTYPQTYPGSSHAQYGSAPPMAPQDTTSKSSRSDSIIARAFRSSIYIIVFGCLGLMGGTALITWEYLSPLTEEGSEEERELLEEIRDIMDDHNLVYGLREDGWKEIDLDLSTNSGLVDPAVIKGRSMIYQVLKGTKGIVGTRIFHHPDQEYSILVFFTGFGIEGWPDVVHGGIITSLLEESIHKHVEYFHGGDRGQTERIGEFGIKVDFKKPVKPGSMYAVLIPPASRDPVRSSQGAMGFGPALTTGVDRIKMVALFMQMDGAPKVSTNTRAGTNIVEHKIDIPNQRSTDGDNIHAVAEVTMKIPGQQRDNNFWSELEKENASIIGKLAKRSDDESP